jgi:hypothetical protein
MAPQNTSPANECRLGLPFPLRGRAPEPPGANSKPYGKTLVRPEPTPEPALAGAVTAAQPATTYPVDAEPEVCYPDSTADDGCSCSPLSYDQDGFRLAEILVGAVVVGVIIVAPAAAPAVLRLAW